MAAAADREMPAAGLGTRCSGFQDFKDLPPSEVVFFKDQANASGFPRQGERDEYGAAVRQPSHGLTAVNELGKSDLKIPF